MELKYTFDNGDIKVYKVDGHSLTLKLNRLVGGWYAEVIAEDRKDIGDQSVTVKEYFRKTVPDSWGYSQKAEAKKALTVLKREALKALANAA